MQKEEKFSLLVDAVNHCRLCPRLSGRPKILGQHNGNIHSPLVFIAEAPGRRGADRTGVPLFGDQSGHNFQFLLDSTGWTRTDIFISNAILCNPRDHLGKNDTPQKAELLNCSVFLKILIDLISPRYVVTLGQKALDSLKIIEHHHISLAEDVRKVVPWYGRHLIPLYHPSPRAMICRTLYRQLEDFYFLKEQVRIPHSKKPMTHQFPFQTALFDEIKPTKLQKLAVLLLNRMHRISRFKLAKLLYLIDYESLKTQKKLITNAFYVRGPDGPIPTSLSSDLSRLESKEIISTFYGRRAYLELGANPRFQPSFSGEEMDIITSVLEKHMVKNDRQLKTFSYLTTPMRRLLRSGRSGVRKMGVPLFTPEDFEKR